jgi:hypothetical protein
MSTLNLYRVSVYPSEGVRWPAETGVFDTLGKARTFAKRQEGPVKLERIAVPKQLDASDWIDLLLFDCPGRQEGNRTPVDFIRKATEVAVDPKGGN